MTPDFAAQATELSQWALNQTSTYVAHCSAFVQNKVPPFLQELAEKINAAQFFNKAFTVNFTELSQWALNQTSTYVAHCSVFVQNKVPPFLQELAEKINAAQFFNKAFTVNFSVDNPFLIYMLAGLSGNMSLHGLKDIITNRKCSALCNVFLASTFGLAALMFNNPDNPKRGSLDLTIGFVAGFAFAILTNTICYCCCNRLHRKASHIHYQ